MGNMERFGVMRIYNMSNNGFYANRITLKLS